MNDTNNIPRKGLLCSVYTAKGYEQCLNGGISSRFSQVLLVGPDVPQIFEADDKTPIVLLVKRNVGGVYLHAEPIKQPTGMIGPMAGGAFIYTSDSRFPSRYPISLHDRWESQRSYDMLTR
jgi:hypothetical protein